MKNLLNSPDESGDFDRRFFLQSGLAAGTMVLSPGGTLAQDAAPASASRCRFAFKGEMTSSTKSMGVLCH